MHAETIQEITQKAVVLIPAYNEEASIERLVQEIQDLMPSLPIVVVSDGSVDHTAQNARRAGAHVLDLPANIGVSGAMQAGFRYILSQGWQYVIRCDGDGQHAPSSIPHLIEEMAKGHADLIVGSRFLGNEHYKNTALRNIGIWYLATFLSYICRCRVTDPTSGFHMFNHKLIYYFAHYYPSEYPEPESLALLRRQGYIFSETAATFRKRMHGVSSLNSWSSLYYAIKVTLALIVDRARSIDQSYSKKEINERLEAL